MRITPVSYNQINQKQNSNPAFGAIIIPGELEKITKNLASDDFTHSSEAVSFLETMREKIPVISAIKFDGKDAEITLNTKGSADDKEVIVYAFLKGVGRGESSASPYWIFSPTSGKTFAKRLIKAIQRATDNIANSNEYLSKKAEEIEKNINNPQPKRVEMPSELDEVSYEDTIS